jgi:diadenosine tetraphosphatase ApaH/serine/threonine PP2A family protein phosphatase
MGLAWFGNTDWYDDRPPFEPGSRLQKPDDNATWLPIETAPKDGREKILLKVPYNRDGVLAWSNTWWLGGFSVENKPTHWKPAPNGEVMGGPSGPSSAAASTV